MDFLCSADRNILFKAALCMELLAIFSAEKGDLLGRAGQEERTSDATTIGADASGRVSLEARGGSVKGVRNGRLHALVGLQRFTTAVGAVSS